MGCVFVYVEEEGRRKRNRERNVEGILWNTRDNTAYEIEIPDRASFLDAVTRTVTKGMIKKYHGHRAVQEMPRNVKNEPHTGKAEEYEGGSEKMEKPGKKRKFWFQFWK